MTMFQSIQTVLRKYADFSGRAGRPEFWWFALFAVIGHAALNSLNIYTGDGTIYLGASLSGAFGIATLVPLLAVTVRRLRDAGRSTYELFWLLLPVAGLIVLVVILSRPGFDHVPIRLSPPAPAAAV